MAKQSRNFRLDAEVLDLIKEHSDQSPERFGTHLSQAQVVEMAVRQLNKDPRHAVSGGHEKTRR